MVDEEIAHPPNASMWFTWGVILLILGIVGLLALGPKMDVVRSGIGQFAASFDDRTAREFQLYQFGYYGSIAALILGGLVFLGGVIKSTQKK